MPAPEDIATNDNNCFPYRWIPLPEPVGHPWGGERWPRKYYYNPALHCIRGNGNGRPIDHPRQTHKKNPFYFSFRPFGVNRATWRVYADYIRDLAMGSLPKFCDGSLDHYPNYLSPDYSIYLKEWREVPRVNVGGITNSRLFATRKGLIMVGGEQRGKIRKPTIVVSASVSRGATHKYKSIRIRAPKRGDVVSVVAHRIVAAAWCNPPETFRLRTGSGGRHQEGDHVVDHINNNPVDNRAKNLRIVTHAQNMEARKSFIQMWEKLKRDHPEELRVTMQQGDLFA